MDGVTSLFSAKEIEEFLRQDPECLQPVTHKLDEEFFVDILNRSDLRDPSTMLVADHEIRNTLYKYLLPVHTHDMFNTQESLRNQFFAEVQKEAFKLYKDIQECAEDGRRMENDESVNSIQFGYLTAAYGMNAAVEEFIQHTANKRFAALKHVTPLCSKCQKVVIKARCCFSAAYCSAECQAADFAKHRLSCSRQSYLDALDENEEEVGGDYGNDNGASSSSST